MVKGAIVRDILTNPEKYGGIPSHSMKPTAPISMAPFETGQCIGLQCEANSGRPPSPPVNKKCQTKI